MQPSMSASEIPTTISEILIVGSILFYNHIHSFLLFIVTHELFRQVLVDYKEIIGAIVGTLGVYYMLLKIKREKGKSNNNQEKK